MKSIMFLGALFLGGSIAVVAAEFGPAARDEFLKEYTFCFGQADEASITEVPLVPRGLVVDSELRKAHRSCGDEIQLPRLSVDANRKFSYRLAGGDASLRRAILTFARRSKSGKLFKPFDYSDSSISPLEVSVQRSCPTPSLVATSTNACPTPSLKGSAKQDTCPTPSLSGTGRYSSLSASCCSEDSRE